VESEKETFSFTEKLTACGKIYGRCAKQVGAPNEKAMPKHKQQLVGGNLISKMLAQK